MKDSLMAIYEYGYTLISYLFLFLTTSPENYNGFGPVEAFLIALFAFVAAFGTSRLLKRKK